ncbi:hypothetical protein [Nonomuraea endophytica]|uniref:hypothetical protein n=1 Tax=Nonomuraea endophytica TaxID=714136 RepID=UPI0037C67E43
MESPSSVHVCLKSSERLSLALSRLGITTDVHDGYGLALVSVWVGLVVWCDGESFWWLSGWDDRRERAVYAWHSALEPERTANRVAHLRKARPIPEGIW